MLEKDELKNTFITKALKNIRVAEYCFENEFYDDCANRIDYDKL